MTLHNNRLKYCSFAGCCGRIEKHKTYCKKHQELKDFQNQLKQNTGRKYDITSMFSVGLEMETKKPITIDTGRIEKQKEVKQEINVKLEDFIVFDKRLNLIAKKCEYKKDIEGFYFENHNRFKIIKRKLPYDWDVVLVYQNGEFYKKMTIDEVVETYKLQRGTVVWRLRVGGVERRKMHIKRQPLAELLINEMQKIKAQIEIEKYRIDTLKKKDIELVEKQDYSHLSKGNMTIAIRKHKREVKQKYNQEYIDFLNKKKFEMLCFVECESKEYQDKLKTFLESIAERISNRRVDNEK